MNNANLPLACDAFENSKNIDNERSTREMAKWAKEQRDVNSIACSEKIKESIALGDFWAFGATCQGKGMLFYHAFGEEFEKELSGKQYSFKCETYRNGEDCTHWKIYYASATAK